MNDTVNLPKTFRLLSELLLGGTGRTARAAAVLESQDLAELTELAISHHVIMRSFPVLQQLMADNGNAEGAELMANAIEKERARIQHAVTFLDPITRALQQCGRVIVIKSLDHWPDFGSDIDLYVDCSPGTAAAEVAVVMRRALGAEMAERSWGDRLANKWNFIVPGLPELVEIHVGRLGQTGEQTTVTESLVTRARTIELEGYRIRTSAPEDRMIVSTLQRMYRHFYIRLCDIADNARLMESGTVDYIYLRSLAQSAGLWGGLATYLVVVSDYVKRYRGEGIDLPTWVTSAARFGGDLVYYRRNWLRIPIVPHAARLYAAEWKSLIRKGEIRNTLRLSLLPGLATAAALEQNLTGSDKGIW
ncbi:MAG TPA: hypothetical protein VK828_20150 [Terriglobales bacterium]|jgi:hypothetical protein|nr:hypothetical protein [Terriglobales bacterium]